MKEKHLEFIQGVINRHNSNSFMIKGWTVTIVAAIFALSGTVKDPYLSFIALGPAIMFWVLDSMFLANERCFVSLYMCVANNKSLLVKNSKLRKKAKKTRTDSNGKTYTEPNDEVEFKTSDYSMNFIIFRKIKRNNWYRVLFSYTIIWFYSLMMILIALGFFGMKKVSKKETKKEVIEVKASVVSDTLKIETVNTKQIQPLNDTIKKP